jgi:Restriction endonuclease
VANTGKAFELLTKDVFEELAKLEGLNVLELTHNKTLIGLSGAEHQIDVYFKFELFGAEHESVIEAKDFQSPVDKPRLMAFVGVLNDLKSARGMFVTRSGFDKGNIYPIAEAQAISLYVLDEHDEPAVGFTLSLLEHFSKVKQIYAEPNAEGSLLAHLHGRPASDWLLYDESGVVQMNFQQLLDQSMAIMESRNVAPGGCVTVRLDKEDLTLYFHTGNAITPRIRCYGVEFERQPIIKHTQSVDIRKTHLLQLVTSDKTFFVLNNGKVCRPGAEMTIPFHFDSVGPSKQDAVEVQVHVRLREPDR